MYISNKNKALSLDNTPKDADSMSRINVKKLSESLQISSSTVSKALNNCFGVDSATRSRVLHAAADFGYISEKRRTSQEVFCILPDSPSYFWRPLFQGLCSDGYPCRCHILSTLSDESLALEYLRLAKEGGAKVLIVSLPMTEKIRAALEEYAEHALVILLTQFGDVKNTVYVGEDARQTGWLLGEAYLKNLSRFSRIILLESPAAWKDSRRSDGFLERVLPEGIKCIGRIKLPDTGPALASRLARELSARFSDEFDCVYCNNGLLYHVALALEKLRMASRAICVGYEYEKRNQKYIDNGLIAAWAAQDPYLQGIRAMSVASHYLNEDSFPDNKFIYLPSEIQVNPLFTIEPNKLSFDSK